MKGLKMPEQRTIKLPKTMPLVERITCVSKEITGWLESLEEPFNVDIDMMRLIKYERNGNYSYHYVIERAVR
jgi:hypothetical protein